MSRRPGTFDTTGPLFNPRADNGVLDALVVRLTQILRRVGDAAAAGRFAAAAAEYHNDRKPNAAAVPAVLHAAEPWSAFNAATRQEPESRAR